MCACIHQIMSGNILLVRKLEDLRQFFFGEFAYINLIIRQNCKFVQFYGIFINFRLYRGVPIGQIMLLELPKEKLYRTLKSLSY